jgi:hypothetical protein
MSLPALSDLKGYLRIDGTTEDTVLTMLLASARGMVERYLERPITAISRTFVDPAETIVAYGRITALMVPVWPVHPGAPSPAEPVIPAPVITDVDGAVVDAATYRVAAESGRFIATRGESFPNGPYTIVASVGLSADPRYAEEIEPVISQAILDVASDLYANRTPSAQMEAAGGGASTSWRDPDPSGLPARTARALSAYKPVGIA